MTGSETVGPISVSTTYTLTCDGPGGSVVRMLSVSTTGRISIAWAPPTANVDGSTLTDLSGYRIHYGTESGSYTRALPVDDPMATEYSFEVVSGEYFVAMTALDRDGNESAISNEVVKIVP